MDMVQREDVKDRIILRPCPGVDQPSHLWGAALPKNREERVQAQHWQTTGLGDPEKEKGEASSF